MRYREGLLPNLSVDAGWLNGLNLASTFESYHPNRHGNSLGYAPLVRSVVG
jgi:hypothetical protein